MSDNILDHIKIIAVIFIIWNFIVFAMYGIDKRKAQKNKQRICEKTLLFSAFFMGGIGALVGINFFRHKTKHLKFKIGVPLLVVLNIVIISGVAYMLLYK